ncbi:methyltransferase [Novosphingobium sp. PC22D]|uniref:methyltransferase domain-containing protein n=1 Tax=Novosphingobium sp. PC22D TaxID=1962403 RepID=UPI000BF23A6F|nr:methyltransferase domain-containing protein [Novosphingobium sp. PC22D]PEQ11192.1 methyltransferase [Novosphingobium sp. PC22D]
MTAAAPPRIFDKARRAAVRRRAVSLQSRGNAPAFILADMVEDVRERLAFLRCEPRSALVVGDWTGTLAAALDAQGCRVTQAEPADGFDEERPYPQGGFEVIASLGTLDTVNDLPGALVHIREALAVGGRMIASFCGAGSLPALRAAMLAADGERPAARIHPQVDARAGGQLVQRIGFGEPVADLREIDVAYRAFDTLIADLRAQGLTGVLADRAPALGRAARDRARSAFEAAREDGRTRERFTILTLSGLRPPPQGKLRIEA